MEAVAEATDALQRAEERHTRAVARTPEIEAAVGELTAAWDLFRTTPDTGEEADR